MHTNVHRHALIRLLDRGIDVFIVLNLVAIAGLVCLQVLLRYVLRMPLLGIEELCYFPTTWLYLGAAAKASSEKSQLVARVLELFIKKQKSVYLLRSIAAIVSSGILCWLCYWGYDLLCYTLRMEKLTDTLFLPWLVIEGAVFVSMALMVVYTILELIDYLTAYRSTDSAAEKVAEEVSA